MEFKSPIETTRIIATGIGDPGQRTFVFKCSRKGIYVDRCSWQIIDKQQCNVETSLKNASMIRFYGMLLQTLLLP